MKKILLLLGLLVIGITTSCSSYVGESSVTGSSIISSSKTSTYASKSPSNIYSSSINSEKPTNVEQEISAAEAAYAEEVAVIEALEAQILEEKNAVATSMHGIEVYADDYLSVNYRYCEQDGVVFNIINKTEGPIVFYPTSLALDGKNVQCEQGYYTIAALAESSIIIISSNGTLPTFSPDYITLSADLIDKFSGLTIDRINIIEANAY